MRLKTRKFVPGVLDLDMPDLPDSAHQLHVAAKYVGDYVADLRPDIVGMLLISSHHYYHF